MPVGAAAAALILALSSDLSFFNDEFEILGRPWTLSGLLTPHNEHWSTVLVLIYRGLADLFGTSSHAPFVMALIASHLFAASAVYALIAQTSGADRALVGTSIFLLFGAGFEDLLWAFQIGFNLSLALSCWALVLSRSRPATAALLLTIGLATQGIALAFIPGAAILSGSWRRAIWFALPMFAYLSWLTSYGASSFGGSVGTIDLGRLLPYIATGVTTSLGSVFVPNPMAGLAIVGILVICWRGRRPRLTTWIHIGTLVALFTMIGLVRAELGPDQAGSSRYLYVAAPLVLSVLMSTPMSIARTQATFLLAFVFAMQLGMLVLGHAYLASIQA